MDPRQLIREAAIHDEYQVTRHAADEADKDGISTEMIEQVMPVGTICGVGSSRFGRRRYKLHYRGRFVCVESLGGPWLVVTVGRER